LYYLIMTDNNLDLLTDTSPEPLVKMLEEEKVENIEIFSALKTGLADWFIIGTCSAEKLMDALIDKTRKKYVGKILVEGSGASGWVLIDMGAIVIHLMSGEKRKYYKLEELWETLQKSRKDLEIEKEIGDTAKR